MQELDCLIIRQPFASLIAFGLKRWEFRSKNTRKRGKICIASARGKPLRTGDQYLNNISSFFPRGFVLATADLSDSYLATSENLKKITYAEETIKIHGYTFKTTPEPFGEPLSDLKASVMDKKWKNYIWAMENVIPFKKMLPLKNGNNSIWTKVELDEKIFQFKNIQSLL